MLQSNSEDENELTDSPYSNSTITCNYYDNEQFLSKFGNTGSLSMLSFNIQSITAKFNEFEDFLSSLNKFTFDIICLQELWKMHNLDMFQLNSHHKLICKSRASNTQGGGVGIFINKNLKFKELPELSVFIDKVIETIFVEVELPN